MLQVQLANDRRGRYIFHAGRKNLERHLANVSPLRSED
jgi:hypothetical protein